MGLAIAVAAIDRLSLAGVIPTRREGHIMPKKPLLVVLIVALGLAPAGCGGPVVTVRHQLPPDLPLPEGPKFVRLGEFTVASGPKDSFGEYAAAKLFELLRPMGECMVVKAFPKEGLNWPQLDVQAALHVDAEDVKGQRAVLSPGAAATGPSVQVPTLVRKVAVRADFAVTDARTGKKLAAETRERYNSADDPRTRGATGLGRPDDPENVQPTDRIVRELLDGCVGTFARMIRPPVVEAKVPVRSTWNSQGRKGLAQLKQGNFHQALPYFQAAVEAKPKDLNLRYDLAVTAEGAGQIGTALENYKAVQAQRPNDAAVKEAILRLERVRSRQKPPAR